MNLIEIEKFEKKTDWVAMTLMVVALGMTVFLYHAVSTGMLLEPLIK